MKLSNPNDDGSAIKGSGDEPSKCLRESHHNHFEKGSDSCVGILKARQDKVCHLNLIHSADVSKCWAGLQKIQADGYRKGMGCSIGKDIEGTEIHCGGSSSGVAGVHELSAIDKAKPNVIPSLMTLPSGILMRSLDSMMGQASIMYAHYFEECCVKACADDSSVHVKFNAISLLVLACSSRSETLKAAECGSSVTPEVGGAELVRQYGNESSQRIFEIYSNSPQSCVGGGGLHLCMQHESFDECHSVNEAEQCGKPSGSSRCKDSLMNITRAISSEWARQVRRVFLNSCEHHSMHDLNISWQSIFEWPCTGVRAMGGCKHTHHVMVMLCNDAMFPADVINDNNAVIDNVHMTQIISLVGSHIDASFVSDASTLLLVSALTQLVLIGRPAPAFRLRGSGRDLVLKFPYRGLRRVSCRVGLPLIRSLRARDTGCIPGWCGCIMLSPSCFVLVAQALLASVLTVAAVCV